MASRTLVSRVAESVDYALLHVQLHVDKHTEMEATCLASLWNDLKLAQALLERHAARVAKNSSAKAAKRELLSGEVELSFGIEEDNDPRDQ